jgi:hypothetical protein
MNARLLAAAAALLAAGAAHAHADVRWSVTIGSPGVAVMPAPVYAPPPVVYAPPPVVYAPAPVYYAPAPVYYGPTYAPAQVVYAPPRGHRRHGHERRHDWDGDGVPNRWDRWPGQPGRY